MSFKPVKYIKDQLFDLLNKYNLNQNNIPNKLYKKSIDDSIDYAEKNMKNCMMFFDTKEIWNYVSDKIENKKENIVLEFGVFQATSINHLSNRLKNVTFHGFDSFEGLQEDWAGYALRKGAFNLNGILPKVNPNVSLHKGWFDKTLPEFIKNIDLSNLKLIHIDSDTYEACVTVLENLKPFIKSGTYILFDEYFGYRGWEIGEFKAFQEFVSNNNLKYEYKAFSVRQVLVEIF